MKNKIMQAAAVLLFGVGLTTSAHAQKSGGVLRVYHNDNPPTASLHEEVTIATLQPFMALFNNLVIYDQTAKRNADDTICGHRYGANGSDFHIRKCPKCQGGAEGLSIEGLL